jgi:transcriptional regulator with PAS, ATPase and Fis domain
MTTKKWLIAWIGKTDHECAEGLHGKDAGPIASALAGEIRYDRVYLLTNYEFERSKRFCSWLEARTGYRDDQVDLYQVDLSSPIDYGEIYSQVSANLVQAGLPQSDVELSFHLSPGTPAMAAIWIILAKTRFPAKLIQTSRERGVESVDFFFDLASDFLPEYLQRGRQRAERLNNALKPSAPEFSKIVHKSQVVADQVALARRMAAYEVPVLILGETGTGKELFAEAIHAVSPRAAKPFVAVNCGAIPPELANSELFGHKKGAFTGASSDRKGHFQEASGGTLFLDEVGDLPLDTQVRLLRVLQSDEVTPLGQSTPIKVNTRIIAATHRNLAADIQAGRFREDLFHRLAVGILRLPPLRERMGDMDVLIDHFMTVINADAKERPEAQHKEISLNARKILFMHPWPGNVRELYHTLLRASLWSDGSELDVQDIEDALLPVMSTGNSADKVIIGQGVDLQGILDDLARELISQAMAKSNQKKTGAAKLLGFDNYQTLSNWMKRLGVDQPKETP